jgi:hypothetical protein
VQKKGVTFSPVNPYGWDGQETDCAQKTGDPYQCITGMKNIRLWAHQLLVDSITDPSNESFRSWRSNPGIEAASRKLNFRYLCSGQ